VASNGLPLSRRAFQRSAPAAGWAACPTSRFIQNHTLPNPLQVSKAFRWQSPATPCRSPTESHTTFLVTDRPHLIINIIAGPSSHLGRQSKCHSPPFNILWSQNRCAGSWDPHTSIASKHKSDNKNCRQSGYHNDDFPFSHCDSRSSSAQHIVDFGYVFTPELGRGSLVPDSGVSIRLSGRFRV